MEGQCLHAVTSCFSEFRQKVDDDDMIEVDEMQETDRKKGFNKNFATFQETGIFLEVWEESGASDVHL